MFHTVGGGGRASGSRNLFKGVGFRGLNDESYVHPGLFISPGDDKAARRLLVAPCYTPMACDDVGPPCATANDATIVAEVLGHVLIGHGPRHEVHGECCILQRPTANSQKAGGPTTAPHIADYWGGLAIKSVNRRAPMKTSVRASKRMSEYTHSFPHTH